MKSRTYKHFDDPLTDADLQVYYKSPEQVAIHSFWPLLGFDKIVRKTDFETFPLTWSQKRREIRYASHEDSAIYSQYCAKLMVLYEEQLRERSLDGCVLAYRSGVGYNVTFARDLFDEIKSRKSCAVVCMDVTKFFDTLDHGLLRQHLSKMLGLKKPTLDWAAILKRITKFEYAFKEDIEDKIGVRKGPRLCDTLTFREKVRPLLIRNERDFGIPQGTPLSGLFANLYMLEFDAQVQRMVLDVGGSYRRYSDDIAIVLPLEVDAADIEKRVTDILSLQNLSFNNKKTCRSIFETVDGKLIYRDDLLQYLGFTFDGMRILIRPSSLKNYYARMKRGISRYVKSAVEKGIPLAELRRRVLVGRFTHWGDDGNFVQYAYRASRELKAPEIKRQLRRHVSIFDRHWNTMETKWASLSPGSRFGH